MCVDAHCTSSPGCGESPASDSLALRATETTSELPPVAGHHHQGLTGGEKAPELPVRVPSSPPFMKSTNLHCRELSCCPIALVHAPLCARKREQASCLPTGREHAVKMTTRPARSYSHARESSLQCKPWLILGLSWSLFLEL